MKLLSFLACAASALAFANADSGKGKPGYCADDTDCYDTYTCVSVQTTRDGVTDVKQCLPTTTGDPICTGTAPGLCPSFSTTWGTSFREISSVCAYIVPADGVKCKNATSTSTKNTVDCLQIQDPDDDEETIGVIYGCVDYDGDSLLFDKSSDSYKLSKSFNYSDIIDEGCINPKNPSGSSFVCSSQGTCSPQSAGSLNYTCECNVGFSGTYCEKIVDNKCYNDGVCGGGSCDLSTNECTDCPAGTKGDKCAECDPTYNSTLVCNGHGTCVASSDLGTLGTSSNSSSSGSGSADTYQCSCDTGYSDVHCDVKVKTTKAPSTSSSSGSGSSSSSLSAATVSASISVIALTIAAAFSA